MSEAARIAMGSVPEIVQEGGSQADPGFLWEFWYPAMGSDEIHGRHLAKAMLHWKS